MGVILFNKHRSSKFSMILSRKIKAEIAIFQHYFPFQASIFKVAKWGIKIIHNLELYQAIEYNLYRL